MKKLVNIAVLVSGGGTNLQAIIDFAGEGKLESGKLVKVISSKAGVYALERANEAEIPKAFFINNIHNVLFFSGP